MRAVTRESILALLCGVSLADNSNCSEGSSHWMIDEFVLKVYDWDNGGTMGTIGFRSYYSGTNQTVECLAQDVDLAKLGQGPWSKCKTPGTEFLFDFTEIALTMKETWTCPGSPGMVFNANATGSIMLHGCLDSETAKGIESDCNLMELEMAANSLFVFSDNIGSDGRVRGFSLAVLYLCYAHPVSVVTRCTLDIAIHPNFAENNLVYFSYAEQSGNQARAALARAKLVLNTSSGGALQDVTVIWRQTQNVQGGGHYGHRILFDANSTLWLSSGERQQFDPAQSMTSNLGKILRLKDDGTAAEGNPFTGAPGNTFWALGIRNPLGIDFDEQGRLWEVEMGPMGGDELNLIERGGNYGWPVVSQGNHYDGRQIPKHNTRPEFIAPKVFWNPVISPSSLVIYKGDLFSSWKGNAIISGLGAQGLVRVEISGTTAREVQRIRIGKRTRCVRQGPDGALWVLEDGAGGRLLRLTP